MFIGDDEFISRLNVIVKRSSDILKNHRRTRSKPDLIDGCGIEQLRNSKGALSHALGAQYANEIISS